MAAITDEFGIQRSDVTNRTPEGRIVEPGTTLAEYKAMLAAESAASNAIVERVANDPRVSPLASAQRLGGGSTNYADGRRRIRETRRG